MQYQLKTTAQRFALSASLLSSLTFASANPARTQVDEIHELPERVEIIYKFEPIAEFPDVPEQLEKFRNYHQPVACKLTKEGKKFRIENFQDPSAKEPTSTFCYDGKSFYYFVNASKILTISTTEQLIRGDLESSLYMSPFTFFYLFNLSEEDKSTFMNRLLAVGDKASISLPANAQLWADVAWKNNDQSSLLVNRPDEITVKFFVSEDRIKEDRFDSVNSRKITISSVSVPADKLGDELFSIPLSVADSLIDMDAGGEIRDLK